MMFLNRNQARRAKRGGTTGRREIYLCNASRPSSRLLIFKLPQQPILATGKSAHCGRTEEEVEPTIVIETPDEKKVGLQVPEIYAESVVPDFKMVLIWGHVVL